MAEVIYYADYNVKITSDWARLGQQVYQVADIGAVAVQTAQPKPPRTCLWKWIPNLAKLALAIGTMNLVILTLNWLVVPDSSFLKTLLSFLSGLLWFLYAGVMLLSSRQASLLPKPVTTIQLNGTFGNVDAITTNDAGYAQMIAFAINQAVARRAATVTDAQQGPAIDWSSVPPVIFRPNDDIQITSNWLMFGKRSFRAINLRYTELKRKRIAPTWQL